MYLDDVFSIGVVVGLKTIILNKHGLPIEQKSNTYSEYMEISNNDFFIKNDIIKEENEDKHYKDNYNEYLSKKRNLANGNININIYI